MPTLVPGFTHITITLGHFVTYFLRQADWVCLTPTVLRSPTTGKQEATFLQALCQVLPYRPVIILDLAWVITTANANVVRKCYGEDSTIGTI